MKRILVPMLGETGDEAALSAASAMAARSTAHVDVVLFHRDPVDTLVGGGNAYSADLVATIKQFADEEIAVRREFAKSAYESWLAETDGVTGSFSEKIGVPEHWVPKLGRLADLIILARPNDSGSSADRSAIIDATVGESGRPVMLASNLPAKETGKRIMMAWNGSAEAARAMAMAMPVFASAEKVIVVGVDEKKNSDTGVDAVENTFKANGINAEIKAVPEGPSGVADTLLDQAYTAKADLIVIGAYSHSRMREMIFGGVTRDLIKNISWPVLMAG